MAATPKSHSTTTPLECSICTEELSPVKESLKPHLLSCAHSFCRSCLVQLFTRAAGTTVLCPVCRKNANEKSIEECKPNFQLIDLLNYAVLPKIIESVSSTCEFCAAETDCFCSDCPGQPPLCQGCFERSHVTERRKLHKMVSLNERTNFFCQDHPDEKLKLFCLDDQQLVCLMCAQYSETHKGHKILPLKDAAASQKIAAQKAQASVQQQITLVTAQLVKLRQDVLDKQMVELALSRAMDNLDKCFQETDDSTFLLSWSRAKSDITLALAYPDSTILDAALMVALNGLIDFTSVTAQLLYRGSRDGFQAAAFHRECNNKGPTLTIIRSIQGNVFGGYTSCSWTSSGSYVQDPKAWLFSLKAADGGPPVKIPCTPTSSNSIYDHTSSGPTFGGGHDLHVVDNANSNATNYSNQHCYPRPRSTLASLDGSRNFQVSEIEVFSLKTD